MHASPQGRSQAFETKTPAVITTLGVQQNSDQARSQWGGGAACPHGSARSWLSPQCRKGQPGRAQGLCRHGALCSHLHLPPLPQKGT